MFHVPVTRIKPVHSVLNALSTHTIFRFLDFILMLKRKILLFFNKFTENTILLIRMFQECGCFTLNGVLESVQSIMFVC